ncbi:hypothetical protein DVA86_31990 [Streptomyces armeniacus]|uniref:LPXTG cell wall anchor domain-containing protein n=1 Tax=Streptomyces armeniacus TaxID=83291 RepID=A0A345XXZ6_9ACTN|nr:hypothetical protein [Streptomyces armeniacus]AXK36512.1 hypothetical protein DVA86_31990 [Streptomyces armeniacus]
MRAPSPASALSAAAAVSLLLAPAAYATPQGDYGTVRIHDAASGEEVRPGGPEVCTFYLDGDGFDGSRRISWQIAERTESGGRGTVAETGTLVLDGDGHGRTGGLSLADGSYELIWNLGGERETTHTAPFAVDCDSRGGSGGTAPSSPAGPERDQPSEPSPGQGSDSSDSSDNPDDTGPGHGSEPGPGPEPEPETEPPASATAVPEPIPSEPSAPSPNGDSDLAQSGSGLPTGALATAAASLLGAGTYLVLRRRNTPGRRR